MTKSKNKSIFPQLSPDAPTLSPFRGEAFKYVGWALALSLSSVTYLGLEGKVRRGKPEK